MSLTLKAINAELAKRGHTAVLENGHGYFYFVGSEADGWLDRTVQVPKVSSLTLEQWVEQSDKLKKRNAEIVRSATKGRATKLTKSDRKNVATL
jgi:hypothetical protein